jgi:DNA processing protein
MEETSFWVAFSRIPGIGRARIQMLEAYFGSLAQAWRADASELRAAGLDARTVAQVMQKRPTISPEREMERLTRLGITALTWRHPDYPPLLREISDPPPVLYVRGHPAALKGVAVAVVGTRRPTAYGRQVATQLSLALAQAGITVVSGLARGIDAAAHTAALEAGGTTVAVLACGLDLVYPPEHVDLARRILERGALVSDYPLGTQPRSEYFFRRNRIMSGLSLGVLVVEGDIDSGALITAKWAVEQGRDVFAVPGPIYSPQSRGPHWLIQQGAKLVQQAEDILEELNVSAVTALQAPLRQGPRPQPPLEGVEGQLLQLLTHEPRHVDEVCHLSGLPVATVSSTLAILELKGLVQQVGAMTYVRAPHAP